MALNELTIPADYDHRQITPLPFRQSGYVNAAALAANTAENIAVPAGAKYCRLSSTGVAWFDCFTTATVPTDTSNGGASSNLGTNNGGRIWLLIPPGVTNISVISSATPIVTGEFFT